MTVHELGHFLAAKWLGTAIERFSIGFGKAIAQWRDKAGVEWRVGWLPLGGYVKFAGDENAASIPDADDLAALRADLVAREGAAALARYFHFKPLWQRAIIVAAGPVANFLLAITIFAALLISFGEQVYPARVDRVVAGSPAERGGFRAGDVILELNGRPIDGFADVKRTAILSTGTPMTFVVDRGGVRISLTATPERGDVLDQVGKTQRLGVLGLSSQARAGDAVTRRYNPIQAVARGAQMSWDSVAMTVKYIGRMVTGRENSQLLSGPLGMAQMSGDMSKRTAELSPDGASLARNWALTMLEMVANISVGIGFLNLLPIPVLDGGHLLFYGYEAVARRPLAAKVQAAGYRVGLALVLGLMLFATWNDLQRLRVFNLLGGLFS